MYSDQQGLLKKRMTKFYLILFFLSTRLISLAQLNESDTAQLQLQVRSGGSLQTGNVELLRITNQIEFSTHVFKKLVFKTQNNHLYQQIFGTQADDDLASRNYLYLNPQHKIYPYAIGYISTNFRRKINLRTFTGLGATYQALQKRGHTIKLSTNMLYEKSNYSAQIFNFQEFDGSSELRAFWSTLYISGMHQFKNSTIQLIYELYWQQSLEAKVNFRYHILGGVDFNVVKGLSIQSRIIYAFEHLVIVNVKEQDLLWTWGLSYHFKKN